MTLHTPPQGRDPKTEVDQRQSDSPNVVDGNCYEWMNIALDLLETANVAWERGSKSIADNATARAQVYATLASSPHLDSVPRWPKPAGGGVELEER